MNNVFKDFYKQTKHHRFGDYLNSLKETRSDNESESNTEFIRDNGRGNNGCTKTHTGKISGNVSTSENGTDSGEKWTCYP